MIYTFFPGFRRAKIIDKNVCIDNFICSNCQVCLCAETVFKVEHDKSTLWAEVMSSYFVNFIPFLCNCSTVSVFTVDSDYWTIWQVIWLISDKMKQAVLFSYEMLCTGEGVFEFCHKSDFLSRSQVDDIISFLACEWYCTLHTACLPSALYCICCLGFVTLVTFYHKYKYKNLDI